MRETDRGTGRGTDRGTGRRTGLFKAAALLVAIAAAPGTTLAASFTYDFSTAAASPTGVLLNGNDSWLFVAGSGNGANDVVRNSAQPDGNFNGNYYESLDISEPGNGDSIYIHTNDANFSYAIPSNAAQITFSAITRHTGGPSSVGIGHFGFAAGGATLFTTGSNLGGWFLRDSTGASAGATGTGALLLDNTAHTWRLTATIDMTPVGSVKTGDLFVENLSDGGSQLILNDVALDFTTFTDPSAWDGIHFRVNGNGSSEIAAADDLIISYVLPEPGAPALLVIALAGLVLARRVRAAQAI